MAVRLEAVAGRSCKGAALYRLQQDEQLPTVLCQTQGADVRCKTYRVVVTNTLLDVAAWMKHPARTSCQLVVFRALCSNLGETDAQRVFPFQV
jgi:hypothetical protein